MNTPVLEVAVVEVCEGVVPTSKHLVTVLEGRVLSIRHALFEALRSARRREKEIGGFT